MREIEFRGKRITDGKWVFGFILYSSRVLENVDFEKYPHLKNSPALKIQYLILEQPGLIVDYCGECDRPYDSQWDVVPETVGQFIGQKDKNGKKIYENDWVEWEYRGKKHRGLVCWDKYLFNVSNFYSGFQDYPTEAFSEDMQFEVVGNIYDNPELVAQ